MCYSVMVKQDISFLAKRFGALVNHPEFDLLSEKHRLSPKSFQSPPRIYPGYFSPIVAFEDNKIQVTPMRYRIRPSGSPKEVPSKYNMFNARLDSLNVRPTWRSLLGRRHGIVLVEKFFEWVEDAKTSKKKVISFSPTKQPFIQVPVLWDYWTDGQDHLRSFALITDDPPQEVLTAGHDRSPICLNDAGVVKWLSLESPMSALNDRSEEYFLAEDTVP